MKEIENAADVVGDKLMSCMQQHVVSIFARLLKDTFLDSILTFLAYVTVSVISNKIRILVCLAAGNPPHVLPQAYVKIHDIHCRLSLLSRLSGVCSEPMRTHCCYTE